jgi:LPS export ABC transporter protein LptC
MKSWQRLVGYLAVIAVLAGAYFIGRAGRSDNGTDLATNTPDPGYVARDAVVIETGYDGRERYRLNARVIHQQNETAAIDLEQLVMDYHAEAQDKLPGEAKLDAGSRKEVWHLTSDRGQVRADGDDVELHGNVRVTGPTPGGGEPLAMVTDTMRINTPTEFIETDSAVKLNWSGHELDAKGMQADLKAGTLRLESDVNGHFSQKKK